MVCKHCGKPIESDGLYWWHKEGDVVFCFNVPSNRGKMYTHSCEATPLTQSDIIKQLKIHGL